MVSEIEIEKRKRWNYIELVVLIPQALFLGLIGLVTFFGTIIDFVEWLNGGSSKGVTSPRITFFFVYGRILPSIEVTLFWTWYHGARVVLRGNFLFWVFVILLMLGVAIAFWPFLDSKGHPVMAPVLAYGVFGVLGFACVKTLGMLCWYKLTATTTARDISCHD